LADLELDAESRMLLAAIHLNPAPLLIGHRQADLASRFAQPGKRSLGIGGLKPEFSRIGMPLVNKVFLKLHTPSDARPENTVRQFTASGCGVSPLSRAD
jgi:hypothetical protein